ncbi:MAG: lipoyl(octanoyl) transferase LipB [Planctomycetes bacterium]|nr:lipoyl(octanoyl) transferase LipB [Planctomycetota bacterium]
MDAPKPPQSQPPSTSSSADAAERERNVALRVVRPGIVGYAEALQTQRDTAAGVRAGTVPETLFLLQHRPVVTMGRRATGDHVLLSREALLERGVDLVETDRGGDVTFHGPGQIVGYPILDLRRRGLGPHTYLRFLEAVLIDVLATYGIRGFRDPAYTGVWTEQGKIAAMGIRVSGGVSLHGFALNVNTDLRYFGLIVPCGIQGRSVAGMDRILGRPLDLDEVMDRIETAFRADRPREVAVAAAVTAAVTATATPHAAPPASGELHG